MRFDFSKTITKKRGLELAEILNNIQDKIGFKVSSRGWCYLMEQGGYISKDQFSKVEEAINRLRKNGVLPVDFVAEEDARSFSGIDVPTEGGVDYVLKWMIRDVANGAKYYHPDWWAGEEYYIQMLVEKIDLKTLFGPVCEQYHIPIANSKGWSSILQRAEYCKRFKEAEERGLKCVLLYCGDHDPDGLRISDMIRENLNQISEINWQDGTDGYNPEDLIIERFGLNFDFIEENGYTWIDNLMTGRGGNLNDPNHVFHYLPYVQNYLKTVGARKCEANAMVTTPGAAEDLVTEAIEAFLGSNALARFRNKRIQANREYEARLSQLGLKEPLKKALDFLDNDEDSEEENLD